MQPNILVVVIGSICTVNVHVVVKKYEKETYWFDLMCDGNAQSPS
jgi:hypothetical protein